MTNAKRTIVSMLKRQLTSDVLIGEHWREDGVYGTCGPVALMAEVPRAQSQCLIYRFICLSGRFILIRVFSAIPYIRKVQISARKRFAKQSKLESAVSDRRLLRP